MLDATMWLFTPGGENNWHCRWVFVLLTCRSPMLNINEFHILLFLCIQCSLLHIIYKTGKLLSFLLRKTWDQQISTEVSNGLFTHLWWHPCLAGSGLWNGLHKGMAVLPTTKAIWALPPTLCLLYTSWPKRWGILFNNSFDYTELVLIAHYIT